MDIDVVFIIYSVADSMRNDQQSEKAVLKMSPKHSPLKSAQKQHPLSTMVSTLSKQQSHVFSTLSQKCSVLQYAIAAVEVATAKLAERVQKTAEGRQAQMLSSLRIKQADFIIGELRGSLLKQQKKEQRLLEELDNEKKKVEKQREESYRLQVKNASLVQKNNALETALRKKTELLESSNLAMQKMRGEQESDLKGLRKRQSVGRSSEEYSELQGKIEQLQREFNCEVQKLLQKNKELSLQLKQAQDSCAELTSSNKALRRQAEEVGKARYELQIKVKQGQLQLSELQESHARLVEKSTANEVMLHKQLQEYKLRQLEMRSDIKKEKKLMKAGLSALAQHINASKYYFTAPNTAQQLQQLKKLHEKALKKKLETVARELDYQQTQHQKANEKIHQLETRLAQLQRLRPTCSSAKDLQEGERASQNGSLLNNRSHDRSQEEKRGAEQKYRAKMEALRKDVRAKQAKISDLQKQQQIQFDRNKEKILQLELAVSEKTNDIRKLELKYKERQYQFSEYQAKIKELEGRIKFLTEKLESEKEAGLRLLQMKTQSYEQKLRLVKGNYKELQKKDQEKTIKYNKLKSKHEKYQLEATESLKRKNAQIDQLLKDNNKLKAEHTLLQEKLSINTIIETEINKNKTPAPLNQDLLEQIEMERDRITQQLADQQKKYRELVELNERLAAQATGAKKEGKEMRAKLEEIAREERLLREENKVSKDKIQYLSQNLQQQDEAAHSYLKKELQKSVANTKKLEKACQKYLTQREERKKQLEEKVREIEALKASCEKLKDKRVRAEGQLQQEKEGKKRMIIEYERKLSECAAKEEQLVDIINYKNREGNQMRESMKGEELIIEQEVKIKFNMDTMTDQPTLADQAVNTDIPEHHSQGSLNPHERPIIPSELILDNDNDDFNLQLLEKSHKQQSKKEAERAGTVNYFGQLIMGEEEDHFDICEDGEEVLERASANIQLKESFGVLRGAIQKVFNEEEVSVSTVKLLPKQLQDDFNELLAYIKEKITQIQGENNLTFIMAEAGNEPSDIQSSLQQFINKPSTEYVQLRRIIQEKQLMITSLMNEKTEQENTINDQQNVQEETERLHLQQYSLLKSQIHQQKQALDKQQLYYESLRNILKKMMNFWIEDEDNYEDFQDNLQLITTIYKFSAKEMELLKLYLSKYRELKQIH